MIFQMGIQTVLNFKKTLRHIKKNNKFLAALEMMNSSWYKQTPLRVENLIKNFNAVLDVISKEKPSGVKGNFVKSAFVTSTMGISYKLKLNKSI